MNTNLLLGLLFLKKSKKNDGAVMASTRDKISVLTMLSTVDEQKPVSAVAPVLYHKSKISEKEARQEAQRIRHQLVKNEAELNRLNGKLLAEISTNVVNKDRLTEEIEKLQSNLDIYHKENESLKQNKLSITKKLNTSQEMLKKASDEIEFLNKQQKKNWALIENAIQKDLPGHLFPAFTKSRLIRFLKDRLEGGTSAFSDVKPAVRQPTVTGLVKDIVSHWKKVMESAIRERELHMDEMFEIFKDLMKNDSDKPLWQALASLKGEQFEELTEKIIKNHQEEFQVLMDRQIEHMRSLANVSDKLELLGEVELKALWKKVLTKRLMIQHQLEVKNTKKIEALTKKLD